MVILHVKKGEKKSEYLVETLTTKTVDEVKAELVEVHNLRIKVLRMSMALRELGKHGPLRPEETRGLSDDTKFPLDINAYGKPTAPDEYGYRTGCPPPGEVGQVLINTADDAENAAKSDFLLTRKVMLTKAYLQEHIDLMRGAVMIAYPAFNRLPWYDPVRLELEGSEELDGASEFQDVMEIAESTMWFAGKEMMGDNGRKKMVDYVGKNEKTKLIIKLQSKTAGAPVREPRVDEDTHKAMLSYYYKRQEENKRLVQDDDDSYLEASWADSKALKNSLVGGGGGRGGGIAFRPGGVGA